MTQVSSPTELAEFFELPALPPLEPRYNVAPSQNVLVVRRLPDTMPREGVLLRWGLIPSWAKDPTIGSRLINARAETAADKPAFRHAFRERRCIVPAGGFYEWQRRGAGKQPYLIRLREGKLFGLAGLWESWTAPEGTEIQTFTILTTAANDLVRQLHDRMPVILDKKDYGLWLDPAVRDPARLTPLLRPYSAELLAAVPVSPLVNDPRHDGPECAAPLLDPPPREKPHDKGQQLLF